VNGWWAASHFFSSFFPLEHWEVQHPGEGQHVFVGQLERSRKSRRSALNVLLAMPFWSAMNKNQVANLRAGFGLDRLDFFRLDEFLGRAPHTFGGQRQQLPGLLRPAPWRTWSGHRLL